MVSLSNPELSVIRPQLMICVTSECGGLVTPPKVFCDKCWALVPSIVRESICVMWKRNASIRNFSEFEAEVWSAARQIRKMRSQLPKQLK